MIRQAFLKEILSLILIIAVLHISAVVFYFYWSIWWYDLPLHYLGGIWISLASLWCVFFSGYIKVKAQKPVSCLMTAIIFAMTVGIFWELFELLVGATFTREGYRIDTVVDLIMDLAGALTGYLYFVFKKYEKELLA